MSFDSAAVLSLRDQVISHALKLGVFDKVANHEPKNAPGNGLFASIYAQEIDPLPDISGLAATSGRVAFHIRIETNMLQEPQDDIDGQILIAATTLIGEYSAHFTLGGTVRNVDLLGAHRQPLKMPAPYLRLATKRARTGRGTLPTLMTE